MFPTEFNDMSKHAIGSGSVLYHCAVSALKISTLFTCSPEAVLPPATISADWRLNTPMECLAVGIGGIFCFHFLDFSVYVSTSLLRLPSLFFPPMATSLPLTSPRPKYLTGSGGRVVQLSSNGL